VLPLGRPSWAGRTVSISEAEEWPQENTTIAKLRDRGSSLRSLRAVIADVRSVMRLHFKRYGDGEPLIILHGLFGSLDNWHSMSTKLAARFQVLAVDQRNHGASPHSPEMSYPIMADDLDELMRAEGLARAHVMGHSMGGKTAMQFALRYPHLVENLVVVDIAPRVYSPRHAKILEALLALDLAAFQTRKQIEDALAPAIPELGTRRFLLKNLTRGSEGHFAWKFGLREINVSYEWLSEAPTSEKPYEKPALFIRGESSDFLKADELSLVRELFPKAELRTIPAAAHLPHVENPEVFLENVIEFLRSPARPADLNHAPEAPPR
jgi:esterase